MRLKLLLILVLLLSFSAFTATHIYSQSSEDDTETEEQEENDKEEEEKKKEDELNQKQKEIEELEKELERVRGEKQTLSSTINYLNSRINLTVAQINQTENQLVATKVEIKELGNKITALDKSLSDISELLINRIAQTYKSNRMNPMLYMFASNDFSEALTTYKYLRTAQKNDREVMYQMEATKLDFNKQKELKQQKEDELETLTARLEQQKAALDRQQLEKQQLLEVTRNDERKFQRELAQKMAELEAIQSIIAGKGNETEVGKVKEGETIAKVIPGPSTCSSGAHLHLEVVVNKAHRNPADYLSAKSVTWDNGPDSPFSFNGSWAWPLNDQIRITQGYGMTFYAATMRYYGGAPHTGIDMVNNSDYTVKAVKDGTLYRGGIGCAGGTLRYVRVQHDDSTSSYYLHVNY